MALPDPKVGLVVLVIQTEALIKGSEGPEKQTPRKDAILGAWTVERPSPLTLRLGRAQPGPSCLWRRRDILPEAKHGECLSHPDDCLLQRVRRGWKSIPGDIIVGVIVNQTRNPSWAHSLPLSRAQPHLQPAPAGVGRRSAPERLREACGMRSPGRGAPRGQRNKKRNYFCCFVSYWFFFNIILIIKVNGSPWRNLQKTSALRSK